MIYPNIFVLNKKQKRIRMAHFSAPYDISLSLSKLLQSSTASLSPVKLGTAFFRASLASVFSFWAIAV